MIEINLLPIEFRAKKEFSFEQIFKTKIIFTVLAYFILFHLLLHIVAFVNTKRLNILKNNWRALSSKEEKIDQLKDELSKIDEKIPLIEQLISNRVLWSKKMNQLSNQIISGIWLNKLGIEKRKTAEGEFLECLIIRGSAASRTKDEPALIGRFMQNLKDDPSFSSDFTEIELGPIKKRLIEQTEIMDFVLNCWFKPDRTETLLK